ncbi:MAG: hypothetical protein O2794_00110 [bacterium]|nr:hypothetical protein [bacterium]
MNLLPPEYKKELPLEAWRRYLTTLGIYFSVVGLVGVMLLLPSFFFLKFQIGGLEDELTTTQGIEDYREMKLGKTRVSGLNTSLAAFVDFEAKSKKAHPVIDNYIKLAKGQVDIQTLRYIQEEITGEVKLDINGRAPLRASFISFLDDIKADPLTKAVDSPISNLLTEVNGTFNLNIDIKQ